ncbi:hypothetical protein GmHk_19G054886 [Glycine max]|nr:hypothetical protein GmHk_19G054886 [Glycine max]
MHKENWTQTWPMGSEIYPEVHENPRAFFSSSSPILLEPLAHDSSDWSVPREDCIIAILSFSLSPSLLGIGKEDWCHPLKNFSHEARGQPP